MGVGLFGVAVLLAGILGGIVLGSANLADVREPRFDWTLCLLVAGPALVGACVCWAASSIIDALAKLKR